ncbi:MAG TPA: hydroxyacid dehydrogenase, partial [Usitatibacter sp.]|nr:hydroxyacid dehydrogenase [Usitatibacter sp.]
RALEGADIYHISSARNEMAKYSFVTAGLLERNPHLLAVSTYGAGYDSVDVAACTKAGVIVMNQAGANRDSVAEHTIALILGVVHRLVESDHALRTRRGFTREDLMGREVKGMTLGLVGIGHVGTTVARLAAAFGLNVIATDPLLEAAEIERRGARAVSFEELISTADIVSLHCPRDATTVRMMGAAQFARMKRGSYFITTARGGIHDEMALAEALSSGHLAGAGLDVWDPEPPPLDHPLLQLPNVFATYHTAGVTHEARRNLAILGSEQIVRLARGDKPPRLVNPQAWEAFTKRASGIPTYRNQGKR